MSTSMHLIDVGPFAPLSGDDGLFLAECDSCDWSKMSDDYDELIEWGNEHQKAMAVRKSTDADKTIPDNPLFWMEEDKDGNPCFWWTNPYYNEKEKIANLWWPGHPVEATAAIEYLFEHLRLTFIKEQSQ